MGRQVGASSFLQGKVGYRVAPSSAPVCALGHLPPEGKAWGVGKTLPVCKTTRPSPPSRWAGRYGRKIQGRRPGRKETNPRRPPNQKRWGPGRKNLFLPGVLSSGFLPKKAGPPPGAGRATGRCAPRHRKSPHHPKGTQYPAAPPPGTGREPTSQVLTCAGSKTGPPTDRGPRPHLGTPAV